MFDLSVKGGVLAEQVDEQVKAIQYTEHMSAEFGALHVVNIHPAEHALGFWELLE